MVLHGFGWSEWSQGPGGPLELIEQGVMQRFEATPLGIGEAGGREIEAFEVEKRLTDASERLLEPGGEGAEGRGPVGLRPNDREGIVEKGCALALGAGRAPGGDQSQGLPLLEAVAEHGIEQRLLLVVVQGAQGIGERRSDPPAVDLLLGGTSQPGRESVTPHDPGLAAAEQTRDGGEGETVVADERVDDPRLVHRRDRPRRCVGAEQQDLALGGGSSVLEDGRDLGRPGADPAGEPLEAVDDLEGPVFLRNDAHRQIREELVRRGPRDAGAKSGEARAQALDGQAEHGDRVGRRPGSRTDPWNRSKSGHHHADR